MRLKKGRKEFWCRQPAGLRLGFVLGATVPIGTGGSRAADPLTWAANGTGAHARSTLDNAMFAVNDRSLRRRLAGVDAQAVGQAV